jgi:hypothetical protein
MNNWKDIANEFSHLSDVNVKGKKLIVKGLDKNRKFITKTYTYNHNEVAQSVAEKLKNFM